MALLKYNNAGISGIAAAVPGHIIDNYEYTDHFPKEEVNKVVDKIGVYQRRFADENTCSSDLCLAAAQHLIEEMGIDKSEIDVLLFVSQTPDYRMPATSVILQHKLGLKKETIAFDITLGCSAFVFALQVAYSLIANPKLNKVLILNGETRSKVYSPKDRTTAFLFGDAGVAVIIEKDDSFGDSYFSLNSDGSKSEVIKIDGGGYRQPSSVDGLIEKVVDDYGNIRNDEHGYIDGVNVFNFAAKEVPKDLMKLLSFADKDKDSIDYYIFHQANKIINDFIAKKLKLDHQKVPSILDIYGNTSSVSVPLTIVSRLINKLNEKCTLCLCAFGNGLSWGSAIINLHNCHLSEVIEI